MASIVSADQLKRVVEIPFPPRRIVSLVPSQTELLFDLGLEDSVAGVTRFCIHPKDKIAQKVKVGGTKQFDFEKIAQLQPDLIIGNKEENYEEGIAELQRQFPVWMSDVNTLEDAFAMIKEVGRITGTEKKAEEVIQQIFFDTNDSAKTVSVAYFIWRKPYMAAAGNTFINEMLMHFGAYNVLSKLTRYPEIDPAMLSELNPDFIFLSSEPYAFKEIHFEEFQSFSPKSKIVLVDGEMFSWYGSRLRLANNYFRALKSRLRG
ncbi:MAG: ABC transporter substrate-binding protein [Chitinophagales bacterium]|nr:ABC transporter substrate-binding protein [Chitinophagales bacterium]